MVPVLVLCPILETGFQQVSLIFLTSKSSFCAFKICQRSKALLARRPLPRLILSNRLFVPCFNLPCCSTHFCCPPVVEPNNEMVFRQKDKNQVKIIEHCAQHLHRNICLCLFSHKLFLKCKTFIGLVHLY